jgi:hypothetical protein
MTKTLSLHPSSLLGGVVSELPSESSNPIRKEGGREVRRVKKLDRMEETRMDKNGRGEKGKRLIGGRKGGGGE